MEENKPFIFGVATSGENFTDRVKETARLQSNFQHGINTILISPRRWGKTSLVRKVAGMADGERMKVVVIDIFSCRSEQEFYECFAQGLIKQTSSRWQEWVETAKRFLSGVRPTITIDSEQVPKFSLSFSGRPTAYDIDEILSLPEKLAQQKHCKIVVCLDEFQQIAEFKDSKTFQKRLRSVWQLQTSVSYCLFGSKKHLMNELFEGKSLPFYKFGDIIYLQKIQTPFWVKFLQERFASTGKEISEVLAVELCKSVNNHSSYVQHLAWLTWLNTERMTTSQGLKQAIEELIEQNTPMFEKQTESLTAYQMNFLRALLDGVHSGFTSVEIIQKYQLGTSANIRIIKNALLKKELIEIEHREVFISDPVMEMWLRETLET